MTDDVITRPDAATGRPPRRFAAIVSYTLRSCLPRKRRAAMLLPCVGALLFGLLAHAVDDTAVRAFANVAAEGIFGLLVPIAALVVGDAVLGAEVRAGTFHFTWLSPAPTWQIVLGRWIGGSAVVLLTIAAYSYGPILGLFAFAIFTRRQPVARAVPFIAIAAPVICYAVDHYQEVLFGAYRIGLEILALNGALTFAGLWIVSRKPAAARA